MRRHARPRQPRRLVPYIVVVWGAATALWAAGLTGTTAPAPAQAAPEVSAPPAALEYEAPAVDTRPAQAPAPLPWAPVPPCAREAAAGPGWAPCHWDAGERGGARSFLWTGAEYITLIDPQP